MGAARGSTRPPDIEIWRESILSATAARLIGALNAELLERYPEDGTPDHFRLEPLEVAEGRGAFLVATLRGRRSVAVRSAASTPVRPR